MEDLLYFYAKNNLVLVNIYIKDPVVTKIWRDEKTPVIHFVAYTGGLLGLCMGFSLVSLFEIIYYSLKTLPWKTWLRMKEIRFVFFFYDPNYPYFFLNLSLAIILTVRKLKPRWRLLKIMRKLSKKVLLT